MSIAKVPLCYQIDGKPHQFVVIADNPNDAVFHPLLPPIGSSFGKDLVVTKLTATLRPFGFLVEVHAERPLPPMIGEGI